MAAGQEEPANAEMQDWRDSWTVQDKASWPSTQLCIGEMIKCHNEYDLLIEPVQVWVRVRRVFKDNVCSTRCDHGHRCRDPQCPLRHSADCTEAELKSQEKFHGSEDDYSYGQIDLGPVILLGRHGHFYATDEHVHISLWYGPMCSSWEAERLADEMNIIVKRYWGLSPLERPDVLIWNRKFYCNKDGECEFGDHKVDIAPWTLHKVETMWRSGELWLETRLSPSDQDFEAMMMTWAAGNPRLRDRLQQALLIEKDLRRTQPPLTLKRLHTVCSDVNTELDAVTLKGDMASEFFDLAAYLASWLAQVGRVKKWDGWTSKHHKIQGIHNFHITWRRRASLRQKPSDVPFVRPRS